MVKWCICVASLLYLMQSNWKSYRNKPKKYYVNFTRQLILKAFDKNPPYHTFDLEWKILVKNHEEKPHNKIKYHQSEVKLEKPKEYENTNKNQNGKISWRKFKFSNKLDQNLYLRSSWLLFSPTQLWCCIQLNWIRYLWNSERMRWVLEIKLNIAFYIDISIYTWCSHVLFSP